MIEVPDQRRSLIAEMVFLGEGMIHEQKKYAFERIKRKMLRC